MARASWWWMKAQAATSRRPSVGSSRRTRVLSPSSTSRPGSRSSAGAAGVWSSPPSSWADGRRSRLLIACPPLPAPEGPKWPLWPLGVLVSLALDGPVRNRRAGHPLRRDGAEAAGLEVGERVHDLLAGVHHERPVHGNRLADRRPAEDHHVQRRRPGLLVHGAVDRDRVAGTEDGELAGADR